MVKNKKNILTLDDRMVMCNIYSNGISVIANAFSYFDIPLLEETSNIIARVLFGTVLVTGIISFFSLIFGPGRLYNNPK